MRRCLTYDDVLLVPKYSNINSRSEIDISSDLGNGVKLELPIISSPMDTVTQSRMAKTMGNIGGMGIIHRYNSISEQVNHVKAALTGDSTRNVGAAVGITNDFAERAQACVDAGANLICIDVAHGHHELMKMALTELRKILPSDLHIMAGNVATLEGFHFLAEYGANSIRCNIGGGSICSTRTQTGHGVPGLQTFMDCAWHTSHAKVIADGGIKNSGDIVKALAAGADAVICGSLLAGTEETPGAVIFDETTRGTFKIYRGMASKSAQVGWKGRYSSYEGVESHVPFRGPLTPILEDIERGVRSGFSYSGARSLAELHAKAVFVEQTSAGKAESATHIATRKWTNE